MQAFKNTIGKLLLLLLIRQLDDELNLKLFSPKYILLYFRRYTIYKSVYIENQQNQLYIIFTNEINCDYIINFIKNKLSADEQISLGMTVGVDK